MRDLSLHLLDIVQNSVKAEATLVKATITIYVTGWMDMIIEDNGKGMEPQMLTQVKSPFFTTRTTRPIGLGIPLLYENAKRTKGEMEITSAAHRGTRVAVTFDTNHIDCLPLGNLGQTLATLCACYPTECEFVFTYVDEGKNINVKMDTRQLKEILQEVPVNTPDVLLWIEKSVQEEIELST